MNTRHQRTFIVLLAFLAVLLLACDLSSLTGSMTKPTVIIAAPASGTRVNAGAEVAVQSTATDAQGIARIELWVDGAVVRSDALPAPQTSHTSIQRWTATTPGAHAIQVRAYNTAGGASDPATISIEVVQSTAQGAPASPASGATTTIAPPPASSSASPSRTPTLPPPPLKEMPTPGLTPALSVATPFQAIVPPTATPTRTPTATPTATATQQAPTIYRQGKLLVRPSYNAELDAGKEGVTVGADFQYHAISNSEQYLEPVNGALFKPIGTQPNPNLCISGLSATPIRTSNLYAGLILCYRTDEGRAGMLRVESYPYPYNPTDGGGTLETSFTTYAQ